MTIINAFNSNFIAVEVIYVQSLWGGEPDIDLLCELIPFLGMLAFSARRVFSKWCTNSFCFCL